MASRGRVFEPVCDDNKKMDVDLKGVIPNFRTFDIISLSWIRIYLLFEIQHTILNISDIFIVPYKTNDRSLLTPINWSPFTNMAYLNHIVDKLHYIY